jgi:hypothetical protein
MAGRAVSFAWRESFGGLSLRFIVKIVRHSVTSHYSISCRAHCSNAPQSWYPSCQWWAPAMTWSWRGVREGARLFWFACYLGGVAFDGGVPRWCASFAMLCRHCCRSRGAAPKMERGGGDHRFPGVPLSLVGPHRLTLSYRQFCAYCSRSHSHRRLFRCLPSLRQRPTMRRRQQRRRRWRHRQ